MNPMYREYLAQAHQRQLFLSLMLFNNPFRPLLPSSTFSPSHLGSHVSFLISELLGSRNWLIYFRACSGPPAK